MRYALAAVLGILLWGTSAMAAIHTETVEYMAGDVLCKGYLAYDDAVLGKRPGVLVIHEWWGLNDYPRKRAEQLAALGYVAFAGDLYGQGATTRDPKQAGEWATALRRDRALMRSRARAALDTLMKNAQCDATRVAAMGYCFGGGATLELARSGAPLRGAVSFHGNLDTPNPADAKNIKAKVLVFHGGDDPNVPVSQVTAFWKEMQDAKVNWQLVAFGGAVHAFTNPAAGNNPATGAAYNAQADQRSWEELKLFLSEVFNPGQK